MLQYLDEGQVIYELEICFCIHDIIFPTRWTHVLLLYSDFFRILVFLIFHRVMKNWKKYFQKYQEYRSLQQGSK